MSKKLTKKKAAKMLKDGSVRGKPLTDKQKRYFASVAYGDTGYLDRDPEYAELGTVLFNAIPAVIGTVSHFVEQGREKRRLKQELAQLKSLENLSNAYATGLQSQGARKVLEGYVPPIEVSMLSPNPSHLPFGKEGTSYAWTGINVPQAFYNLGSSIWEQYGKNPNISKETVGFGAGLIPYIASLIGGRRKIRELQREIGNTYGMIANNLSAIQDPMGGTSLYTKYGGVIPSEGTKLIEIGSPDNIFGNFYEIEGERHKTKEKDGKIVISGGAELRVGDNTVYAEDGEILSHDGRITSVIPTDDFVVPALKEKYPVLKEVNKALKERLKYALSRLSKKIPEKSKYKDKIGDTSNRVNELAYLENQYIANLYMNDIQRAMNALKPLNNLYTRSEKEKEKDFAQTGFVANTDPSDEIMKKMVEDLRKDMKRKNEEGFRRVFSDLEHLKRLEETSTPILPEQKKIYEGEYDLMYGSAHRRKEKVSKETLDEIGRLLKERADKAFWDEYNILRKSKGDEIITRKNKKPKGGGRNGSQTSNLGVEQPEDQAVTTTGTEGGQQGGEQNKDRKFDLNDLPLYLQAVFSAIPRSFTGNLGPLPTYAPIPNLRYSDVYVPPTTEKPPPPTRGFNASDYLKLARTYASQHIPYGRPFYISPIIEAMQEGQVRHTAMDQEAALRYQELAQRSMDERNRLIAGQVQNVGQMIPTLQSYQSTALYDTIGRMYEYLAKMLQAQRTYEAYASLAPNVQLPGFTMPFNLTPLFDTGYKKEA